MSRKCVLFLSFASKLGPRPPISRPLRGGSPRTIEDRSAEGHFYLLKAQLAEFEGAKGYPQASGWTILVRVIFVFAGER